MFQTVLADEVSQRQAYVTEISLGSLELQLVDRQDDHDKPLLGCFKALQMKIA